MRVRSSGPVHRKEQTVSKTRTPHMPLPFNRLDLPDRLSDATRQRAVALLQQMMIEAISIHPPTKERNDEREDSIDPS